MINKRGSFGAVLLIFLAVVLLLAVGFAISLIYPLFDQTVTPIVSEIRGIGVVDNTNFSEASDIALQPISATVDSFSFVFGVLYVICMMMILGMAVSFRFTGNGWLIPVFLIFGILIVFVSIAISNAYEDMYNQGNEVGSGLREQTIMSYLLIYSPVISTFLFFICGIIMFSGGTREEFA